MSRMILVNKMFRIRHVCFCFLMMCILPPSAFASPRVVGYIATFNDMVATIDNVDLTQLTHINLSFANPDKAGVFVDNGAITCMPDGVEGGNIRSEKIRHLVEKAHKSGVKVLISVAGGVIPPCSGDWADLLKKSNRQKLMSNLLKYVDDFNFDGVDIDIEGVILTNIDQAGNYKPFVKSLSDALKKQGKLLTCATASYDGGMIPISTIRYFDFVNIMSYDTVGPGWGLVGGEHSTYEKALSDINVWKSRGLPKDKLVLGVPFYGYGFGSYSENYSIRDLISNYGVDIVLQDVIGKACVGCNYITYNGAPTLKSKTRLALAEGSGIMIWELSQDARGEHSMLSIINSEMKTHEQSPVAAQK